MPMIYCRGAKKRETICEQYDIIPIAHLKLLNNQQLHSCAGGMITDNYYRFHVVNKDDPADEGEIICGRPVALHFQKITQCVLPPLFNPLAQLTAHGGKATGRKDTEPARVWDDTMRELSNSVMILLIVWPFREDSVLSKIQEDIKPYPNFKPYDRYLKSVNTMLKNAKTTLRDILNDMERENGPIREFRFEHIIQRLTELELEQYFEPEA